MPTYRALSPETTQDLGMSRSMRGTRGTRSSNAARATSPRASRHGSKRRPQSAAATGALSQSTHEARRKRGRRTAARDRMSSSLDSRSKTRGDADTIWASPRRRMRPASASAASAAALPIEDTPVRGGARSGSRWRARAASARRRSSKPGRGAASPAIERRARPASAGAPRDVIAGDATRQPTWQERLALLDERRRDRQRQLLASRSARDPETPRRSRSHKPRGGQDQSTEELRRALDESIAKARRHHAAQMASLKERESQLFGDQYILADAVAADEVGAAPAPAPAPSVGRHREEGPSRLYRSLRLETHATLAAVESVPSAVSETLTTATTTTAAAATTTAAAAETAPIVDPPAVRGVGVADHPNLRWRPTMEDAHRVELALGGDDRLAFFGVYDGHGGRGAVDYIEATLHKDVVRELRKGGDSDEDVTRAIHRAYKATDASMPRFVHDDSGSTVVTALVRVMDNGERKLYVGNAGDARAVLALRPIRGSRKSTGLIAKRLSFDHKTTDRDEEARIRRSGGFISFGGMGDVPRVNGMLAITRSLGDHSMKRQVIPDPYQSATTLRNDAQFLVIACDGLFDVVTDAEAVNLVASIKSPQKAAQRLVDAAIRKGTTDNVTVMVVRL